jgi:hypothetical protein
MRFAFQRNDTLPRLAWCCRLDRGADTAHVTHGSWVEVGDGFYFEGAWSDPFSEGRPSASTACFGSGGESTGDAIRFVAPTHMLERIHAIRVADTMWVSNSLVFLLAASGEQLDDRYPFYHFDLMTNMRGYLRYRPSIRTRSGRELRVFFHANVVIDSNLNIRTEPKALPPAFRAYDDYVGYLRDIVRRVGENAADAARTPRYAPLATISSGYDSPACALLAKEIGCVDAATFGQARPGYAEEDDSGSEIADVLGLTVHQFDRTSYRGLDTLPEAEFLAYGAGGEEVVFAPLEQLLPGRLLFTGYLGDAVWNRVTAHVNTELLMLYPGGSSLSEFRLRTGFIHFPVPTAGYIRHPSVYAVSNSTSMERWTLGNDYDRPIPRRLLEEAGVPRSAFGRTKKAITQPLWNTEALEQIMAPRSYRDFSSFIAPLAASNGAPDTLAFRAMRLAYEANLRVNWRLLGVARKLGIAMTEKPLIDERYSRDIGPSSFTFHWGVARTLGRYRA